jgi:hypothetical protein
MTVATTLLTLLAIIGLWPTDRWQPWRFWCMVLCLVLLWSSGVVIGKGVPCR